MSIFAFSKNGRLFATRPQKQPRELFKMVLRGGITLGKGGGLFGVCKYVRNTKGVATYYSAARQFNGTSIDGRGNERAQKQQEKTNAHGECAPAELTL